MGQEEDKRRKGRGIGRWQAGSMAEWQDGRMEGRKDGRMGGQEAEGKKEGERNKTKPYTTIPSRGFALNKLPLDRPHQGAVMLRTHNFPRAPGMFL